MVIQKSGDTFSRALLEFSSDTITNSLSNIGYAFAKVNPIPTTNRAEQTVAINMQVVPGPRVSVRRILFRGNTRTSDEVMRREMRQFENSWYSQAAIDRSKIRLQRLGYFESVEVETPAVSGSNDQVDVVYNVKETTSGSFVFGLGYSQSYGMTTSVQLSQNNFLGGGNRVSVEASRSSYLQRYGFSYTNPYFTDDGVSLGYNLSWRELDYSDFNTAQYNSTNGSAQVVFGVPLTETDTVSLMFGIDSNQITTYQGSTPQSIIDYINAVGKRTFHAWRTELGWGATRATTTSCRRAAPTSASAWKPPAGFDHRVLQAELPDQQVLADHAVAGDQHPRGNRLRRCLRQRLHPYDDQSGWHHPHRHRQRPAVLRELLRRWHQLGTRLRGQHPRPARSHHRLSGRPAAGWFAEDRRFGRSLLPAPVRQPVARVSAFVDFGNVYNGTKNFKANELRVSTGVALLWRARSARSRSATPSR
jgi:outer membrane protein insertion porin family